MGQENSTQEQPQDRLNRLLKGLHAPDEGERMAALKEIGELTFSSQAIQKQLEETAIQDPVSRVRDAARLALTSPALRVVQKKNSQLTLRERQVVLSEMRSWLNAGLIEQERADVLKRRYDFDAEPAAAKPAPAAPAPAPAARPVPPPQAGPPAPRASLTQTLLSETSIKIALYLGAFMVIAAAAILAALVEAARLPILAAVTLGFGAAAPLTRKRLPQPSFVLFVVFSCLLPFDAAVLSDMLGLNAFFNHVYWSVTYAVLAGIWAFSTWFYKSRFFSMAGFIALDLSVLSLSSAFELGPEPTMLLAAIAGLAGIFIVYVVKRWQDLKFTQPLFVLTVLHTLTLAGSLVVVSLIRAVDSPSPAEFWPGYWFFPAAAWAGISAYFFAANRLYRNLLLPWAVMVSLLPIPWTFLQAFASPALAYISAYWTLGALFAIAGEYTRSATDESRREYHWPFRIGAYLPLLTAWIWGYAEDPVYGFGVALASAALFGVLTFRNPHALPWTSTLVSGLAAFFGFFQLPLAQNLDLPGEYLTALPVWLLLIPDLFLKADLGTNRSLRWPPRILGLLMGLVSLTYLIAGRIDSGVYPVIWAVHALLALGFALRYQLGWVVHLFTAFLALAVIDLLTFTGFEPWLPVFTALAYLLYFAGSIPGNPLPASFRHTGLALAAFFLLIAIPIGDQNGAGWYCLLGAGLFAVEQYRHKQGLAEAGIYLFVFAAWWQVLDQFRIIEFGSRLLGVAILWIVLDLVIGKTYPDARPFKTLGSAGGALFAAITAGFYVTLGISGDAGQAAFGLGWLTAAFLVNAWIRKSPMLGYSAAAAFPMALAFLLEDLGLPDILFPLTMIAIAYYAAGFLLRRRSMTAAGAATPPALRSDSWSSTWLVSGLGLGTVLSILAPAQGGLAAVLPVALAATVWTVEAFVTRNVWLGFPSNGLYLMAYFMILSELQVGEPQFYSVGAAGLGLLMHYLLVRSGNGAAAFLTGMLSQLVLLSTTYLQMLGTGRLGFFFVLFLQGLAVLLYGIIIRSRSLVATPLVFIVLGVITVVYSALKGISTVILIGCTGLLLLLLGILAVVLRERLTRISERFSEWQA